MENSKSKLSVFEASAIICGYGVGGGIMAMPYLANKVGILMTIVILFVAFAATYLLHMMIADLIIKGGKGTQIIEIFTNFINKKEKNKKGLTIFLFVLFAIVLYANLAVYIAGAADILSSKISFLSPLVSKILFYTFASIIGIFGLKVLGLSEKYAILVIFGVVLTLSFASCLHITNSLTVLPESLYSVISLFGVTMFAFSAFFSIPQVVDGLDYNVKEIKRSIVNGMAMNMLIMVAIIIFSLLSSTVITEESIIGWSEGIGLWAEVLGSIFVILAMLSTYWSISFALRDIIADATKLNRTLSLIVATLPSFLITLIPIAGFIDFLNIAGGAIAILMSFFVIPAFHASKKANNNETILGKFASLPVEIITFVMFVLMAVGNLI